MEQVLKYLDRNKYIGLLIVLVATFLVYANSLQNGFVIEDEIYIAKWELTQSLGNIPNMFAGDTAPTGNWGIYRPLRAVFYAISYTLWGGNNPTAYHIQALFVHLATVVLVYFVAWELVRLQVTGYRLQSTGYRLQLADSKKESQTVHRLLSTVPFLTALLFGLHPIHSEAVDYLTANFDAIAYIFFFGSFYFYLRIKKTKLYKDFNYYISIALATAAFFYFEMTLTLPFLLLLYDFLFRKKLFKKLENILIIHGPYFLIAGIYLFIRMLLLNMTVRGEYLGGSIYLTFLTMLKVVLKYLEWLVLPLNLSINPVLPGGISAWNHPLSHPEKVAQQTLFDMPVLLSIAVISVLIFTAYYFYKKIPMVSFCIGWFFITILPVMYIIPQGTIFQERYIYIASFGYIMLTVFLGFYFSEKTYPKIKNYAKEYLPPIRSVLITLLIAAMLFYGFRTYMRNKDWKDSFAVWSTLAKQSPEDVIANFQTANLYNQMGNLDQAAAFYQKTLNIEPGLHEPHLALGEIYKTVGLTDLAAIHLQQALLINPKYEAAQALLEKLNSGYTSTESAELVNKEDIWKTCGLSDSISFSCPGSWKITKLKNQIKIQDPKKEFSIDISFDDLSLTTDKSVTTIEEYLGKQKDDFGTVLNQGLASIPGVDQAYVKLYEDTTGKAPVQKLQFFLFKGVFVVKALVYPTSSQYMVKFDRLISSLKIQAENEPAKQ